ncbi:MAG: HAD family hydrolase [Spirochaetales bacterium]|nr:HAD family hydrolase [Spirochaetales bacterium]
MDMTLYRHEDYYKSQIKNQVILLAQEEGIPVHELEDRLNRWKADWSATHDGHQPSFGNTLLGALGVSIERSVDLRRRAIRPEDYLSSDALLAETLETLSRRFRLVLVTNNPADIAERTLAVLGVGRFFPQIIGLDEAGESKPSPKAFRLALKALAAAPEVVVSVGDRYAVDLEVPLSWGMGGVLVETMEDVYSLPGVFPEVR